jgi:hypothetical protein
MPLSLPGFGSLASWIYCRSCLLALWWRKEDQYVLIDLDTFQKLCE